MDEATKQALLSAVRTILVTAATALASHGYIDKGSVETTVGALVIVITLLWGVYDKYRAEKKTQARETVAVQAGIIAVKAQTTIDSQPIMAVDVDHPAAQRIIKAFAPSTQ